MLRGLSRRCTGDFERVPGLSGYRSLNPCSVSGGSRLNVKSAFKTSRAGFAAKRAPAGRWLWVSFLRPSCSGGRAYMPRFPLGI